MDKKIQIRVDENFLQQIEILEVKHGISKSMVIRMLCQNSLNSIKNIEQCVKYVKNDDRKKPFSLYFNGELFELIKESALKQKMSISSYLCDTIFQHIFSTDDGYNQIQHRKQEQGTRRKEPSDRLMNFVGQNMATLKGIISASHTYNHDVFQEAILRFSSDAKASATNEKNELVSIFKDKYNSASYTEKMDNLVRSGREISISYLGEKGDNNEQDY